MKVMCLRVLLCIQDTLLSRALGLAAARAECVARAKVTYIQGLIALF